MLSTDTAAVLARMVDEATATMMQRSGGRAVCVFTKAGQPVPGIKYAEGQWASLRELQRAVDRGADLAGALREGMERWQAKLDGSSEHGLSADWKAYHHGAIDALVELATAVEAS